MTKDEVERLSFMECDVCTAKLGSPVLCQSCQHNRAVISALLARAEAAEAERDRQYDENVHRIMMEAAAHARGREEGLREAAGILAEAADYDGDAIAGRALDELRGQVLALIEKPEGEW